MEVPIVLPQQLEAFRTSHPGLVILDVREAEERQISCLEDDLHIPMNEVPARLGEIDATRPLLVYCRSGRRSEGVAQFLIENGFTQVWNLETGINGYARTVDPSMPTY